MQEERHKLKLGKGVVFVKARLKYLPQEADGNFHFWNLATRKQIKTSLPIVSGKKHYTKNDSALSRDGRRSAWYVKTYQEDSEEKGSGEVDGEFVQVVEDGKKTLFQLSQRFEQNVRVALTPDGKQLVWAPENGLPRIVDLETKETISPFPSEKALGRFNELEWAHGFAFSPNGKTLACVLDQFNGEKLLKLWDQEKKRSVTLSSLDAAPSYWPWNRALAFSVNGQTLAVSDCQRVRLYDLTSGKERFRLPNHRASVRELYFSADGRSLISGDEAVICRWRRETDRGHSFRPSPQTRRRDELAKRLAELHPFPGGDNNIFSPDLTLALNEDRDVFNMSEAHPKKVCRPQVAQDGSYWVESFSPDNQRVLLIRHEREKQTRIAYEVFDTTNGKRLGCWPFSGALSSTFSPDSQFFAWQDRKQGQIVLGNVRSGKLLKTLSTDLSRKPKRPPLMSGFGFNSEDPISLRWGFDRLAVSYDDQRVAAVWNSNLSSSASQGEMWADQDKEPTTLYVWNVVSGKETARIAFKAAKDKMPQVTCLAFLRDGRTMAAGYLNDADVHLIEIASGRERAVLHGHQGVVRSLALSSDGRYLVSGSDDTTMLVWNLDSRPRGGEELLTPKELKQLWRELASTDAAVAFRALRRLRHCPERTVRLLKEQVEAAPSVDPEQIDRWIRELDSNDFEARSRATKELAQLAEIAEPALRKALRARPTLEVRRRLEQLLEGLAPRSLPPDRLRSLRAVEILEAIGDQPAREHLEKLARGIEQARLTCEAKESLRRLNAAQPPR